jgi:heme-degrading monooxygenase HmoA
MFIRTLKIASFVVFVCTLFAAFWIDAQVERPTGQVTGIARVWEGRVPDNKADEYFRYLYNVGVKQMQNTKGCLCVQVFRRPVQGENVSDFQVISYWESRDAIKKLTGADIEQAWSLPRDREFLVEPVNVVKHYQIMYSDVSKIR